MVMEFKKDYGKFEDRLSLFCKPTHWEIEHGITILDKEIKEMSEDLKIVTIKKSDNTETMIIFYNGSKNSNPCWFGWIPSKTQISKFSEIQELYIAIDKKNSINKQYNYTKENGI